MLVLAMSGIAVLHLAVPVEPPGHGGRTAKLRDLQISGDLRSVSWDLACTSS
jgi:hypothetical protein